MLNEMITGIREVQAFSMETEVISLVDKEMQDYLALSYDMTRDRAAAQGATQLIQMWTYALLFFIGGEFIERDVVEFDKFNEALWALMFAASGLGQAIAFMGDQAKAEVAKKKVFGLIDRIPDIDSKPFDGSGAPRLSGQELADKENAASDRDLERGDDLAVTQIVPTDKFQLCNIS